MVAFLILLTLGLATLSHSNRIADDSDRILDVDVQGSKLGDVSKMDAKLKDTLTQYGSCRILSVQPFWVEVAPNPLLSARVLDKVRKVVAGFGVGTPEHCLLLLHLEESSDCNIEGKHTLFVEHNANIEFFSEDNMNAQFAAKKAKGLKVEPGGKVYKVWGKHTVPNPDAVAKRLPQNTILSVIYGLYAGWTSIYDVAINPDGYDVFDHNCCHFAQAVMELLVSPQDLADYGKRVQQPEILSQALKEVHGPAEFKRGLVTFAGWLTMYSPDFAYLFKRATYLLSLRTDSLEYRKFATTVDSCTITFSDFHGDKFLDATRSVTADWNFANLRQVVDVPDDPKDAWPRKFMEQRLADGYEYIQRVYSEPPSSADAKIERAGFGMKFKSQSPMTMYICIPRGFFPCQFMISHPGQACRKASSWQETDVRLETGQIFNKKPFQCFEGNLTAGMYDFRSDSTEFDTFKVGGGFLKCSDTEDGK
eukprot:TRINITY_DN492_c1_g1_i1.p1 TRINITY_DN492_c1_g1~~TRINITY_DN492_c1_g1_i1.p1  ORF type:complete len:478 (-),score=71.83 TRINITY_DN492_c1_g1_i1:216-1649(-)